MISLISIFIMTFMLISHISYAQSSSKATTCEWRVPRKAVHVPKFTADAANLRRRFIQILRSRRAEVPLSVEPANSVGKAEKFYLITEAGDQGRVPVLLMSKQESRHRKRPAIIFLHGTGGNKELMRPALESYTSRGYISLAIDARYHGERAKDNNSYKDAHVSSWKKGDTMPFIYDTVWDLLKLADYLMERKDIDRERIGITGISLGGMHAWFAGFADLRYSVIAPVIAVQGFRWAIDHNSWQGRVSSMGPLFDVASKDLNKTKIDKDVVKKVWDRIAPGLVSMFDSPYTIPALSPRPLLILNGEDDPRCPIKGIETPVSKAMEVYKESKVSDNFKMLAEAHIGHNVTPCMIEELSDWFGKFFKL